MANSEVTESGSPKVSVVITCCNGEPWLQRTVESVFRQTYSNYEIIAVDDASTDGSRQILEQFMDLPHFRLVLNGTSRGIPATKNRGIELAAGTYIALLEQDDEWLPEKLSHQVKALDSNPDLGLVFVTAIVHHPDGQEWVPRQLSEIPSGPREERLEALFMKNPIVSCSSVLFRKECAASLGGFDERYAGADDYDFWLRLASSYEISRIRKPLVRFRLHPESYSMVRPDRMLEDRLKIIERTARRYPFLEPLRKQRQAGILLYSAFKAFEWRAGKEARAYLWEAFRNYPYLFKGWVISALVLTGPLGRALLKIWRKTFRMRPFKVG